MNENQTKAVHEKQRDMKNENSSSISHGSWTKVVQWFMFNGMNSG